MTPEEKFWNAGMMIGSPSLERVEQLREAGEEWKEQRLWLAAGMAFSAITDAGWGLLDRQTRLASVHAAIASFRRCAEEAALRSLDALLALTKWWQELHRLYYDDGGGMRQLRRDVDALYMTLAERLLCEFSDDPNAISFLVRGIRLRGPICGPWEPEFPDAVVNDGLTTWENDRRLFWFRIPSAFRLLVRVNDYQAANSIALRFESAFNSPDLRGWRCAVQGFCDLRSRAEMFLAAADAFDLDTLEVGRDGDGHWSSINRDLWAPYFRSRSWMARAVSEPERADEFISAAAGCMPERGYANTQVHRYHLFVRALAGIFELPHGLDPEEARREFEQEIRYFGDDDADPAALEFLQHAREGFDRLHAARAGGIRSVGRAMVALDRFPLFGTEEAELVQDTIDRRVKGILNGPSRIWIHRTLEDITDERKFHRLLLRLFQNSIPRYAQIRHGPIEYGKDIAVAVTVGDKLVLRMYQAKCGDIKKPDWAAIRPQLEEIFQVPMESFQIGAPVDRRVGILVWNGHAEPHVEPVMEGWKKDQLKMLQREYEFMHLDDVVNYILESRLISAFREAISEISIGRTN